MPFSYEKVASGFTSAEPPMGNRNRPIGPSTVPGRAITPRGGQGSTWLRVYDPIFVTCYSLPVYNNMN